MQHRRPQTRRIALGLVCSTTLSTNHPKSAPLVLAALDVAQDEFDQKFAEQINQLSKHLTVYVSSTDQALLLALEAAGE